MGRPTLLFSAAFLLTLSSALSSLPHFGHHHKHKHAPPQPPASSAAALPVESIVAPKEVSIGALTRSLRHAHGHRIDSGSLDRSFKTFFTEKERLFQQAEASSRAAANAQHLEQARKDEEKRARDNERHANLAGVVVTATKDKGEEIVNPDPSMGHVATPKPSHQVSVMSTGTAKVVH
jgi:hypothetical protein